MADGPLSLTSLTQQLNQLVQAIDRQTVQIGRSFPQWVATPATAVSAGTAGQVAYDSTHFYVCIATNSWVRVALAAW